MSAALDRLLELFPDAKRSGAGWKAHCPSHDDRKESLSIDEGSNGTPLLICRAGCDSLTVLRAKGFSSFAELSARRNATHAPDAGAKVVATYDYRDAEGKVIFQAVRMEPKDFRQRQPDPASPGGWIWNLRGVEPVLYNLPEILAAPKERTVWVVEGEKDADRLTSKLDFLATTNPMGAGKWKDSYTEALRGRPVIVIPDNDAPGRDHAEKVRASLAREARSVEVLELPGVLAKGDVSDWLDAGHTKEDLLALVGQRRPDAPSDEERLPIGWRRPAAVLAAFPKPKFRFSTGLPSLDKASREGLPTGSVVVIVGGPDAGKTGIAVQIAAKIGTEHEAVVVIFTPDGGQEGTAIRSGGLLGLNQDRLEERDPAEIAKLDAKLARHRIFIIDDAVDGMHFERVRKDAEKIRPDLPHVYILDSAQECLANENADELDERHRVIALARSVWKAVVANPIPSLAIMTSQVAGAAFAPRKRSDRTAPIGSPAESKKVSYLTHLMLFLEGDPSREPNFGRATVVKNKLRGPKPTFGIRVDSETSRLREIDVIAVEEAKETRKARADEKRVGKIADRIEALLLKSGPLIVTDIRSRIEGNKTDISRALDGLEAQGRAAFIKVGKTGKGRLWSIPMGKAS